jgi:tRNA(fMet)-specific endonuclease VapC
VGLILDTNILVRAEREGGRIRFADYDLYGGLCISAITASELLVGVHRANSEERRLKRQSFVEHILSLLPILPFDLETARLHAAMVSALPRNITASAYDSIIAATALRHGVPVLTANPADFEIFSGLTVIRPVYRGI